MTKQFLRFTVLIFISVALFSSCKKTHPLHAYPDNMRLLNFTKTTTTSTSPTVIVYENYRFIYDGYNRVSQIIHTKNDGSSNLISNLTYKNDTIYDTTRYVNQSTLIEVDTFVTDQKGLISITYEPGLKTEYTYLGKLLTRKATSSTDYFTYTSYNANILKATNSLDANKNTDCTYYTDKFNRVGDYLQLNGFLKYGFNFYQNDNLIWKLIYPNVTVNIDYVIDADNKITKTTALSVDAAGHTTTEVFDLQYEQFK